MKKLKKLFVWCILILFTFSSLFSGCTSKTVQEEASTSQESKQETVEVDVFQFKVEIAKELEAAAREYEKTHSNIKINIQTVGGGDDYGAALRAKFQSSSEPDIFNIGGPQDVEDWITKLEDLSDQPWVDLALEGILSGVTVDDKIYGLPFNIEGYGYVYNKNIFKDAGIDASEIKDFDSLEKAVKTLDTKIKSG